MEQKNKKHTLETFSDEKVEFERFSDYRIDDKYNSSDPYFETPFPGKISTNILLSIHSLSPTTNIQTSLNRQNIIKSFIKDFKEDRTLLRPLQVNSAAWTLMRTQKKDEFDLNLILNRAYDETTKFFKLLESKAPNIANNYSTIINHESIQNVFKAKNKGGYDKILIGYKPHPIKNIISMQGIFLEDLITNDVLAINNISPMPKMNQTEFIKAQMIDELEQLKEILLPFIGLYSEAIYFVDREKKGKPICFPKINTSKYFSIKNAEPLDDLTNKIVGANIETDYNSESIIFNGLHSGGKTIMLRTLLRYFIDGLSGFTLPAEQVNLPLVKKIKHSFKVEKSYGGKLQSEMRERYNDIKYAGPNTLLVYDEFLQHASPDAAEYLEPVLLNELKKSKALVALVTHRGYNVNEAWKVYHPQFKETEQGVIIPTYTFAQGKPDEEVLKKHALQILEKATLNKPNVEENEQYEQHLTKSEYHRVNDYTQSKIKKLYSLFTEEKNYEN